MSPSLLRKASGAPSLNNLKKHPSTTARKSTSSHYNEYSEEYHHQDQPWATAHLLPQHNNIEKNTALENYDPNTENPQSTPIATMPSNRTNRTSSTPAKNLHNPDESTDLITPLPRSSTRYSTSTHLSAPYTTSPESGHSNVSLPTRPPRKHAYSECFDIVEQNQIRSPSGSLLSEIRSPSGNLLSAQQAALRADRPPGVMERQEAIRKKLRERREEEEEEEERRVREERWKRESGAERDRVMGEMGLGNLVEVVGGVRGSGEVKTEARKKGKGKRGSFCGCL